MRRHINKNLKQIGEDLVISIDKSKFVFEKSLLDLLKIAPDTEVHIRVDGKKIILELVEKGAKTIIAEDEELQKLHERIIEKHKTTLKKLAE